MARYNKFDFLTMDSSIDRSTEGFWRRYGVHLI